MTDSIMGMGKLIPISFVVLGNIKYEMNPKMSISASASPCFSVFEYY